MSRELTQAQSDAIEQIIDATSLASVLSAIESICELKRDHIEVSYGDADLAQHWHSAGYRVRKCAESKKVQHVSDESYRQQTGA